MNEFFFAIIFKMAAAMRRSVAATFSENFRKILAKFVLPEKLRGGRIEKAVDYVKLVGNDYKSALQDAVVDSKARPYKAAAYSAATLLGIAAIASNPAEKEFAAQRTACCNEMALVGRPVRNPRAEKYLKELNDLLNQNRLERIDLVFCSLLVRNDYSPDCQLFAAQCDFLEPTYLELVTDRFVDFGAFGRWWAIDRRMDDFDVNDDEIQSSV